MKHRKHIFRMPEHTTVDLKIALAKTDIGLQHLCEAICFMLIEHYRKLDERHTLLSGDPVADTDIVEALIGKAKRIKLERK